MILTPLALDRLPQVAEIFRRPLADQPLARQVFDRILATVELVEHGVDLPRHRQDALDLCRQFGLATIDEAPAQAFSWDGIAVRSQCEASVLIHELAHWMIAPPERRLLPDFGLGAGPETGRVQEADSARAVDETMAQEEESLASLLGILWEVELGQPAILAFLEQNWLEAYERSGTAAFFLTTLQKLQARRLVDQAGRPQWPQPVLPARPSAI